MTQDTQCVVHNNNDVVQAAREANVEGELSMEFKLAHASFRAIVGTLAAVVTVVLPVFAWQAERFVNSAEETEKNLASIQRDVAVLATKMEFLQKNLDRVESASPTKEPAVYNKDI